MKEKKIWLMPQFVNVNPIFIYGDPEKVEEQRKFLMNNLREIGNFGVKEFSSEEEMRESDAFKQMESEIDSNYTVRIFCMKGKVEKE